MKLHEIEWVLLSEDHNPKQGVGYARGKLVLWTGTGVKPISLKESVTLVKRIFAVDDKIDGAESTTPKAYIRWLEQLENYFARN